jgi:hypothetical protein
VPLSKAELELSGGGARNSMSAPTMNRFMDSVACARLPFPTSSTKRTDVDYS